MRFKLYNVDFLVFLFDEFIYNDEGIKIIDALFKLRNKKVKLWYNINKELVVEVNGKWQTGERFLEEFNEH